MVGIVNDTEDVMFCMITTGDPDEMELWEEEIFPVAATRDPIVDDEIYHHLSGCFIAISDILAHLAPPGTIAIDSIAWAAAITALMSPTPSWALILDVLPGSE